MSEPPLLRIGWRQPRLVFLLGIIALVSTPMVLAFVRWLHAPNWLPAALCIPLLGVSVFMCFLAPFAIRGSLKYQLTLFCVAFVLWLGVARLLFLHLLPLCLRLFPS